MECFNLRGPRLRWFRNWACPGTGLAQLPPMIPWRAWWVGLLACGMGWMARSATLEVAPPDANGWHRLRSAGESNRVQVLQASVDLGTWTEAGVFHGGPIDFADVTAPTNTSRYFRVVSRARTAADDGRNQLALPDDPFAVQPFAAIGESGVNWVKFAILLGDETRVWFQDSNKHPFHHDYAKLRLAPFLGMSRANFDQRTLHRTNQLAVLGAVLIPADNRGEYGIQFVGQDAFPREEVVRWLRLVAAAVRAPAGTRAFYLPTFEQAPTAQANRDWLAAAGFEVASSERWLTSDAVYSAGWALGRLTYVPTAEIHSAYASGRLRATDILLTDAVPAEVPFVAGIITLAPATPNSHVAILAQGHGVPFVWFADPAMRAEAQALAGREVALRTEQLFFSTATLIDVEGQLPAAFRDELLTLKRPTPIRYVPKQSLGLIATNVQELRPDAVRHVGGKAANFGLLRRVVPANSEPAIALTFDLWDGFLAQALPGGRTLREEIAFRLNGLTNANDVLSAQGRLLAVRDTFTKTARFSAAQQAAVLGALTNAGFDGTRKLRFRSSTNVEDSEDFTGAGLYDSYSGCLADELDGDASGPSACDPTEANERGVFRAIQRVYASFYNDNAFLERLRRGVKEDEVGMAVLVHHSYPDEIEMANGVATLKWQKQFGSVSLEGRLVSQLGAESITNPDNAARPETVDFYRSFGSTAVALRQSSSRVPLGGHVMRWETDYQQLVSLLAMVANGYAQMFPAKTEFALDFEYKRVAPGTLDLKQVRPLPQPKATPITTFLLPTTETLCVLEGEFSDVFAKHRLKCELNLTSGARRLSESNLTTSIYTQGQFATRIGDEEVRLTNDVTLWPEFQHSRSGDDLRDSWAVGSGTNRRILTLTTPVIRSATAPQTPLVTVRDFMLTLEAKYATAQPTFDFSGPSTTLNDTVLLTLCPVIRSDSLLQNRAFTNSSQVVVRPQFWWPQPPKGPSAGYTAPNLGFVETRITGLTTEPLVLRARAAQTYSPGHHNFWEAFLFEPRLDPAVSAAQLAELEAKQIRQLVVEGGLDGVAFWVVNAAGKLRSLP